MLGLTDGDDVGLDVLGCDVLGEWVAGLTLGSDDEGALLGLAVNSLLEQLQFT